MARIGLPCRALMAAAMSFALALSPDRVHATGAPDPAEAFGPPVPPLRAVPYAHLPGWDNDSQAEILPALRVTCAAMRPMRQDAALGGDGEAAARAGTPAAWSGICAEFRIMERRLPRPPRAGSGRAHQRRLAAWQASRDQAVRRFVEAHFEPFATPGGIMTGYYEPELRGSVTPDAAHRTPLMARPPELVEEAVPGSPIRRRFGVMRDGKLEPFADRATIEGGALAGRGLELVWVDSAADAFFLHIQGSGRVLLPDGRILRMGYAAQNGQPYVSIGRVLIQRGDIPREGMSMQALRSWLAEAGPERAAELMQANPSYIFFRQVEGLTPDQGPIGAMGVPLTPRRSVAVDRAHIPLGLPMFVTVRDPMARRRNATPAGRLVVAQDTGGAIRGPARTDYFWGWGDEAGERAGRMRDEAEVYLLLPRSEEVAAAD